MIWLFNLLGAALSAVLKCFGCARFCTEFVNLRTLDPRVYRVKLFGDTALRIAKFYYVLTSALPLEVDLISYILMPRVTDLLAVFDGIL